jgi:hypothetical protein
MPKIDYDRVRRYYRRPWSEMSYSMCRRAVNRLHYDFGMSLGQIAMYFEIGDSTVRHLLVSEGRYRRWHGQNESVSPRGGTNAQPVVFQLPPARQPVAITATPGPPPADSDSRAVVVVEPTARPANPTPQPEENMSPGIPAHLPTRVVTPPSANGHHAAEEKPPNRRKLTRDNVMDLTLVVQEERGTIRESCHSYKDVMRLLAPRLTFEPTQQAVREVMEKLKVEWAPKRNNYQPKKTALTEAILMLGAEFRAVLADKVGVPAGDLAEVDRILRGIDSMVKDVHRMRERAKS